MAGSGLPTRTGAYDGTGAALSNSIVGFRPKSIKFINEDTGASAEWTDTMTDATVITHDSGVDAIDAAQGVTPLDDGFSLGTNAVINTSGQRVHWVAIG